MTKFPDDVPLRRNLTETPGVLPGFNGSKKSADDQLILMRPVICLPGLKSPVKGEARKISLKRNKLLNQ